MPQWGRLWSNKSWSNEAIQRQLLGVKRSSNKIFWQISDELQHNWYSHACSWKGRNETVTSAIPTEGVLSHSRIKFNCRHLLCFLVHHMPLYNHYLITLQALEHSSHMDPEERVVLHIELQATVQAVLWKMAQSVADRNLRTSVRCNTLYMFGYLVDWVWWIYRLFCHH